MNIQYRVFMYFESNYFLKSLALAGIVWDLVLQPCFLRMKKVVRIPQAGGFGIIKSSVLRENFESIFPGFSGQYLVDNSRLKSDLSQSKSLDGSDQVLRQGKGLLTENSCSFLLFTSKDIQYTYSLVLFFAFLFFSFL